MTEIYKKKLSLFVAWFNILVSMTFVLTCLVLVCIEREDKPQFFHGNLAIVIIMAVSVMPWIIASIFLIKGIKQNRPKLMAIWIYLGYLQVILSLGMVIYKATTFEMWTGNHMLALKEILPMLTGLVILILCIIPVRKLYQRMSIPTPVQPTQVVMASQMPMEVGPSYTPVFENV